MPYLNADDVLPPDLLKTLQDHVQGCLIYVPRAPRQRRKWGTGNGARKELDGRNAAILEARGRGASVEELARLHGLSDEGIRKILYAKKKTA